MKRKTRIIQISGFRGILMAIFVITCLAAGFVAFPAISAMYLWNYAASHISIPEINFIQGLMLWAIVAISIYILNDRKKYLIAFSPKNQLSEDEMKKVLEQMKLNRAQMINSMILKSQENKSADEKKDKENV